MPYEQKDNSGSLFTNTRKEKDSHPDRTGSALIDGREYWVSGWVKQDRNGKPWLSLSFKPKDAQRERPADIKPPGGNAPQRRGSMKDELNDDIPF